MSPAFGVPNPGLSWGKNPSLQITLCSVLWMTARPLNTGTDLGTTFDCARQTSLLLSLLEVLRASLASNFVSQKSHRWEGSCVRVRPRACRGSCWSRHSSAGVPQACGGGRGTFPATSFCAPRLLALLQATELGWLCKAFPAVELSTVGASWALTW